VGPPVGVGMGTVQIRGKFSVASLFGICILWGFREEEHPAGILFNKTL
jgi:hypothetical protein